jgi:hypothetical protein
VPEWSGKKKGEGRGFYAVAHRWGKAQHEIGLGKEIPGKAWGGHTSDSGPIC